MKQKILAIDDSLTLREFIQRCLAKQSADYQIVLAKDGTEGLALAAQELPDLILLDFVLPDMKGNEVCKRLQADKKTAGLPVVLMSSSAADIKRTQEEYENVIKAIAKPFTPELLCTTVAHALRETAGRLPSAVPTDHKHAAPPRAATPSSQTATLTRSALPLSATRDAIGLVGDTSQFSLISVLLALEQDQLTGVLRINTGAKPLELYVASGRPVLVTLRDAAAYLRGSGHKLTPEQTQLAATIGREQAKTGSPVFLQFAEQGKMSISDAVAITQAQTLRLFSHLWTAPRAHFKYEAFADYSGPLPPPPPSPGGSNVRGEEGRGERAKCCMPPLTAALPAYEGTMSEWAMETLRYVGDDFRSAMAWGEPTGIPAYTRKGYERIQQIPLHDEELAFAGLIHPTASLEKIAHQMGVDVDRAQRVLHRFLSLEIFDYWPASLLQAA